MSYPVVILAGGLGTRLGEITKTIPKALVEVRGEPFLAHQLRLLHRNGIDRVVMCISHLGEMIQDFAGPGDAFGLQIDYCFDGPTLRGTAGAIRDALPEIGSGPFFVLYGDSYLPCDYQAVGSSFSSSGKQALMTVFRNEGKWDRSNVHFSEGRILAYDKKVVTPRMQFIDYGLGVFRADAFTGIPATGCHDLADLYQKLLSEDDLAAYEIEQRFYEIGSVHGLAELSEYLSSHTLA